MPYQGDVWMLISGETIQVIGGVRHSGDYIAFCVGESGETFSVTPSEWAYLAYGATLLRRAFDPNEWKLMQDF